MVDQVYNQNLGEIPVRDFSNAILRGSFPGIWVSPTNPSDANRYGFKIAQGDGVTDDTAAIQAVINAVNFFGMQASGSGIVYLPAGLYKITSPLILPSNVSPNGPIGIRGAGMARTQLLNYTGTDCFRGPQTVGQQRCDFLYFADFTISGQAGNDGAGFNFVTADASEVQGFATFERIEVQNHGRWGVDIDNMQNSLFSHCHFRNNSFGHLRLKSPSGTKQANANAIINNTFDNIINNKKFVASVYLQLVDNILLLNNIIQGNGGPANNTLDGTWTSNGTSALVGTGTLATSQLVNGMRVNFSGAAGGDRTIDTITDDTHLTIRGTLAAASGRVCATAGMGYLLDGCFGCTLQNDWFEDTPAIAGASIGIRQTQAVSLISEHFGGSRTTQLDLSNCQGIVINTSDARNAVANINTDATCNTISMNGGVYYNAATVGDATSDGILQNRVFYAH